MLLRLVQGTAIPSHLCPTSTQSVAAAAAAAIELVAATVAAEMRAQERCAVSSSGHKPCWRSCTDRCLSHAAWLALNPHVAWGAYLMWQCKWTGGIRNSLAFASCLPTEFELGKSTVRCILAAQFACDLELSLLAKRVHPAHNSQPKG